MARAKSKTKKTTKVRPVRAIGKLVARWVRRAALALVAVICVSVSLFAIVNPPLTFYQIQERLRLGSIDRDWVAMEDIAPVMARSVVAAEDANYCLHWGFDMDAIRKVIAEGENRGASTISQQVAKNVFLWHGRNYTRKALEAAITPVIELVWSKRRILEVYLNVVEFDEGVFGIGAAAPHYFGVSAADLTASQAALLASVLPSPKARDAARPTGSMQKRSASIRDGAETIRVDGRAACFED